MSAAGTLIDPAAFRAGMRAMPGAVCVIAAGRPGARTGMTATAVCSLSDAPPMLLCCVNAGASAHPLIRQEGRFSINLLADEHAAVAVRFAGREGITGEARFDLGNWGMAASSAPVLRDALASFDCVLEAEHRHATHSIFVGSVQAVSTRAGAAPLLYLAGGFGGFQAFV